MKFYLVIIAAVMCIGKLEGSTFGGNLQMTVDASGNPEYYCSTGDQFLNIGERIRTVNCFDCRCSYRFGLDCVSVGSALHTSSRLAGCRLVKLPNCCYKFVKIWNEDINCLPVSCPEPLV